MITTDLSRTALPLEQEVLAAAKGQRALAAYLATQGEVQQIQIYDDKNKAHRIELPTSALRLLVDILAELARPASTGGSCSPISCATGSSARRRATLRWTSSRSRPRSCAWATNEALELHRGLRRLRPLPRTASRLPDVAGADRALPGTVERADS